MRFLDGIGWRRGGALVVGAAVFVVLVGPLLGVQVAWGSGASDVARIGDGPELYRWVDRYGVVRYTPDLDRIPKDRRSTVVRVVRGKRGPVGNTAAAQIVQPGAAAGADPWNAPAETRQVEAKDLAPDTALGSGWPELDARIAELERMVAEDEELIKVMISSPASEGSDPLIQSPELRAVATRLPVLQTELQELRSWRDDPGVR